MGLLGVFPFNFFVIWLKLFVDFSFYFALNVLTFHLWFMGLSSKILRLISQAFLCVLLLLFLVLLLWVFHYHSINKIMSSQLPPPPREPSANTQLVKNICSRQFLSTSFPPSFQCGSLSCFFYFSPFMALTFKDSQAGTSSFD